jgi:hypothetical protein
VTPFELSLESDLQVEWQRFANGWFFKWHGMTYEGGATDVDDFRGGRIHYVGIKFGHQQQQVFWQAVGRYLNQKIHEVFKRWDTETAMYPEHIRLPSIDGTERMLKQFVARIVAHGVDTDRRLRGSGYPESVSAYDGAHVEGPAMAEIGQLAHAYRNVLAEQNRKEVPKPLSPLTRSAKWIDESYAKHPGLIWLGGGIASAAIWAWHHFYG